MIPESLSIFTPSFNQGKYIERTVQSVLNQNVSVPMDYFIIDGASTDDTLDILNQYEGKVRVLSEPDDGLADAMNKGFKLCTGSIIGWLNSDDMYMPGALQKVTDYFHANPACLWVYGNCRIIDEEDREIRKWITAYKNKLSRNFTFEHLLQENFLSQPSVFFRRSVFLDLGPLALDLPCSMDYDLWLRLARLGDPGYINEDLSCFRVHGDSIGFTRYKQQFEEQYAIHKRYDGRWWYLFIHRLHVVKTIAAYWLIQRVRKLSGVNV